VIFSGATRGPPTSSSIFAADGRQLDADPVEHERCDEAVVRRTRERLLHARVTVVCGQRLGRAGDVEASLAVQ
jgi:hypothetical protein